MHVPSHHACARLAWNDELRAYLEQRCAPERLTNERVRVRTLLRTHNARRLFEAEWMVWLNYFRWCVDQPSMFLYDPLCIDRSAIDIHATLACAEPGKWPQLQAIADGIVAIANTTRPLRIAMGMAPQPEVPIATA
ncbi:hypothetical protein HYV74_02115 [Candidatus Uhrbacteria bacterium]|nr:hypothetical protein [Candidatus Uhrbacteria bacterium]